MESCNDKGGGRMITGRKLLFGIGIGIVGLFVGLHAVSADGHPGSRGRDYYESRGKIVWEVPTERPWIALTFDDGPDPARTPQILELLQKYEAKATFFVLGNKVSQYPELTKREAAEGHEISNHTFSHIYYRSGVDEDKYLRDILHAQDMILQVTGHIPRLFRPPGGYYNDAVVDAADRSGLQTILWSWHQDTRDWSGSSAAMIAGKVLDNARNGDIVLFHDHTDRRAHTIEALGQILPELAKRGFKFVTVSELLGQSKLDSMQRNFSTQDELITEGSHD
jgi:peptidoglycan/xylan/chitin deacetylase (PgdA/CDA1 family)